MTMKKNRRWKDMAAGALVACLLYTMVLPAAAATLVNKSIQVRSGVGLYVDDQKVVPTDVNGKEVEVFIYNGTTYIPARAVSKVFGKPIKWEKSNNSVYIGAHESSTPAVMLKDLDYFTGKAFQTNRTPLQDNLGNEHMDVVGRRTEYGVISNTEYYDNTYKLNGQYSRIKGVFFQNYYSRSSDGESILEIYGDGVRLYSAKMKGGIEPVAFDVDLSGVLEMEIKWKICGSAIGECGLYT